MEDKQKLLKAMEYALNTEERAIPLYSRHIVNTLFLSGLRPEDQERVREVLDRLRKDSTKHKNMYEFMIKKVKES
jgi:rubrerythrin